MSVVSFFPSTKIIYCCLLYRSENNPPGDQKKLESSLLYMGEEVADDVQEHYNCVDDQHHFRSVTNGVGCPA